MALGGVQYEQVIEQEDLVRARVRVRVTVTVTVRARARVSALQG